MVGVVGSVTVGREPGRVLPSSAQTPENDPAVSAMAATTAMEMTHRLGTADPSMLPPHVSSGAPPNPARTQRTALRANAISRSSGQPESPFSGHLSYDAKG